MAVSDTLGARKTVEVDAGTLEYRDAGDGPPLVFVHGFLVNGDLWRKVVPRLSGEFRCLTLDLPLGSHTIPMNDAADLTPLGLARLIASFLERLDLDDTTVIGNDTGGALTQILITNHPERVGDVVLTPCDAYDNFPPRRYAYLVAAARVPGALSVLGQSFRFRALDRLPIAFGPLTKHAFEPEIHRSYTMPARTDRGVRRDLSKALKGLSVDYTRAAAAKLHEFDGRALIAWPPEDKIFPFAHAQRLSKEFRSARLEPVRDSRTFVPEDQPVKLASLIAEFVGARAGRP